MRLIVPQFSCCERRKMTAACLPGGKESLGGLMHSDRKMRRGKYETDVDRENLEVSSLAITPKDVQPWTTLDIKDTKASSKCPGTGRRATRLCRASSAARGCRSLDWVVAMQGELCSYNESQHLHLAVPQAVFKVNFNSKECHCWKMLMTS